MVLNFRSEELGFTPIEGENDVFVASDILWVDGVGDPESGKGGKVDSSTGHPGVTVSRFVIAGTSQGSALANSGEDYGLPPGIHRLRKAAASFCNQRYKLESESVFNENDIAVTSSGTNAFHFLLRTKKEADFPDYAVDNEKKPVWIITTPGYDAHIRAIRAAGFEPYFIHTTPEQGYTPTSEQLIQASGALEKQGKKVGGIFIALPGNPSGAIAKDGQHIELAQALDEFHKAHPRADIVLDDVYETLHRGNHHPIYSHLSQVTQSVTALILSASKMFGSAGLCGAVVSKSQTILKRVGALFGEELLSQPRANQHGFAAGLEALIAEHEMLTAKGLDPQKDGMQGTVSAIYDNRIMFVANFLREIARNLDPNGSINPIPYEPEAALYILANLGGMFKDKIIPDVQTTDKRSLREVVGVGEDGKIQTSEQLFNFLEALVHTEKGYGVRFRPGSRHGMPEDELLLRITCARNHYHLAAAMQTLMDALEFVDVKINRPSLEEYLEATFNQHRMRDVALHQEYELKQDRVEAHMRRKLEETEAAIATNQDANPTFLERYQARKLTTQAAILK